MSNFQEITEELQYRVKSAINLKDNNHLSELVGILRENEWTEDAIGEFLINLTEKRKKRQPGQVWKTSTAWAGWKSGEEAARYGMKSGEIAQAYVDGKISDDELDKEKDDKSEEEPKEEPKGKKLNDVDEEHYKEEIQPPTDKDGNYKNKPDDLPVPKPLTREDVEKYFPPGIPNKYKDVLVRLLNAQLFASKDKTIDMKNVMDGTGAGSMPAQAAEVFTMIAASMNDEQFNGLMEQVNKHYDSIEKPNPEDYPKGKKDHNYTRDKKKAEPVFNKDWLESIAGSRKVIRDFAAPDEISHCAWDTKEDVEAMGLPYGEKGFSTDAYFRTKSGKLIEVSLKKDTAVMFASPSAGGHVDDEVFGSLEKKNPKVVNYYKKNQAKIDKLKSNAEKEGRNLTSDEKRELAKLNGVQERIKKQAYDELYGEDNPANPFYAQERQNKNTEKMANEISEEQVDELENMTDEDWEKIFEKRGRNLPKKAYTAEYLKGIPKLLKYMKERGLKVPPIRRRDFDAIMDKKSGLNTRLYNKQFNTKIVKDKDGNEKRVPDYKSPIDPNPLTPEEQKKMKEDEKAVAGFKKLIKGGDKYFSKMMLATNKILGMRGDKKAQQQVDDHIKITKEFEEKFLTTTLDRDTPAGKAMYDSTMKMISEKFPLKSIMNGEEKMALGGLAASPEVMTKIFGNNPDTGKPYSYDELEKRFKIKDGKLVFQANAGEKEVTIADFVVRNKGQGYNSINSSTFEMLLPDDMKRNLYCANWNVAKDKGMSDEEFNKTISTSELKTQRKLEKGTNKIEAMGPCKRVKG